MIAGDPGLGKSLLTLHIASTVSRGGNWPVDVGRSPLGSVLIVSAEDDAADTIVPRLMAAGAVRQCSVPIFKRVHTSPKGSATFTLNRVFKQSFRSWG